MVENLGFSVELIHGLINISILYFSVVLIIVYKYIIEVRPLNVYENKLMLLVWPLSVIISSKHEGSLVLVEIGRYFIMIFILSIPLIFSINLFELYFVISISSILTYSIILGYKKNYLKQLNYMKICFFYIAVASFTIGMISMILLP